MNGGYRLVGLDDWFAKPLLAFGLVALVVAAIAFLFLGGCKPNAEDAQTEDQIHSMNDQAKLQAAQKEAEAIVSPGAHPIIEIQKVFVPIKQGLTWLNLLAIVGSAIGAGLSWESALSWLGKLILPPSIALLGLTFGGLIAVVYWWVFAILIAALLAYEIYLHWPLFGSTTPAPAAPTPTVTVVKPA